MAKKNYTRSFANKRNNYYLWHIILSDMQIYCYFSIIYYGI